MTQEEELLLKDLYARQPYKVRISVDEDYDLFIPRLTYINYVECHFHECAWTRYINEIKPFLRPMSSMTEEEKKELSSYMCEQVSSSKTGITFSPDQKHGKEVTFGWMAECLDWLNAHHFDYRGLIEKGLARVAPENMYNTK